MLNADSKHIHLSGEPCPSPERYLQLAHTVTEPSKGHSAILSSQMLQDSGEHSKTSEFHKHGPVAVLHLLRSAFLDQKQ